MGKFGWGIVLIFISLFFIYSEIQDYGLYKKGLNDCQEFNKNVPNDSSIWVPNGTNENGQYVGYYKNYTFYRMNCSVYNFDLYNLIIIIPTGIIGILLLISHFKKKSKSKIKKKN